MKGEPFDAARALRWLRAAEEEQRPHVVCRAPRRVRRARQAGVGRPRHGVARVGRGASTNASRTSTRASACFGLHRDIRFSNDKTPYKTRVSAWLSPFGKSGANAGLLHARLRRVTRSSAPASTRPRRTCSAALRLRMARDARPFERMLRAKRLAPYLPLRTDALLRMPRGFPKDHPHGELIRARNYLVRREYSDAEIVKQRTRSPRSARRFATARRSCATWMRSLPQPQARRCANPATGGTRTVSPTTPVLRLRPGSDRVTGGTRARRSPGRR